MNPHYVPYTKFLDTQGTGVATAGVFQYFFWVLLQPFRGVPTYKDVAIKSYNPTCLENIDKSQTDMKELGTYILIRTSLFSIEVPKENLYVFILYQLVYLT